MTKPDTPAPSGAAPAEDGYAKAFYEIASVLGIGATADTPENVFRNVMLPRIKLMAEIFGDKYCADCRKAKGVDPAALASPQVAAHPDDLAVDRFAAAMKAKLAGARAKGRSGWERPDCTREALSTMLREHVEKGDPRDVANFCMFLHQRGEGIAASPQVAPAGWKLVPINATAEMLEAAWDYHGSSAYQDTRRPDEETDAECYSAMIAAAPMPTPAAADDARTDARREGWGMKELSTFAGGWKFTVRRMDGGMLPDLELDTIRVAADDARDAARWRALPLVIKEDFGWVLKDVDAKLKKLSTPAAKPAEEQGS